MRRTVTVVATALCALAPVGPGRAGAAPPPDPAGPAATPSALAVATSTAVERSAVGRYVVVMRRDPLARTSGQARTLRSEQDAALRTAGLPASSREQTYTTALNGFTVSTDLAGAERLARDPKVALVLPDGLRRPTRATGAAPTGAPSDLSTTALNDALGLTARGGAHDSGLTGRGVVVGVIDTGVWPEHPSLAPRTDLPPAPTLDESGRSACAFGTTEGDPDDAPFACNTKLVGAREFLDTYKERTGLRPGEFDSARDDDGHGTHTATTAAGNAGVRASVLGNDLGTISGIAPDAQVIAYKAVGSDGGYASDLVAAIDQAVADGVDVLNISLGGPPDTVSPEALALLFASDAGVHVAASVGNGGPAPGTIGGPADLPWVTGVGATTYAAAFGATLDLDNGPRLRGASVTGGTEPARVVDGAAAGSPVCVPGQLDPEVVEGAIVVCEEGALSATGKSFAVQQAGGAGLVVTNGPGSTPTTQTTFVPSVVLDRAAGLRLRGWMAKHPVGSARLVAEGVTASPDSDPTMAVFSGRGASPTAGDVVKPDVTAPGVQVLAGDSPAPSNPSYGPEGELFQAMSGASMSTPVVAGLHAILVQAHPEWSPAAARSALVTTADPRVTDVDGTRADPFDTGGGIVAPGRPGDDGSAFRPGLVYDASFPDHLGFLCDEGPAPFPPALCDDLAAAGFATVAQDLNRPSIGVEEVPGRTTVRRTVTNVSGERLRANASVDAPDGFRVTVTPSAVDLAPGASARVTVDVLATGKEPTGTWSFGALTWRGGGYAVRSPIALRGIDLRAPAVVTGEGPSGSAVLDVEVGAAGRYEAVPHGLVGAVTTGGTVGQDPDQTFPSDDDGAGVTRVPVDLTGVAHARWTLDDDDPDTDLDLYLLDGSGEVVASSAEAGTAERLDVAHPAPGTYTLVVHGWQAAPDTAFDVLAWLVPTASGGSLQVTSGSPATVAVGDRLEVGVAWSAAPPGPALGLVEHLVDGRRLADTLVAVTG
ncbi:S8 family serine peptidase [Oryzobacter sp. R7]|uniref:S8 family serine peptidase n=1 Tax=Oryzobacter faecalis TaxID=3388656 RepID=UPI00398C94B5